MSIKYWLWLSGLRVRPIARHAALSYFGSAEALYFAPPEQLREVPGLRSTEIPLFENRDLTAVGEILRRCTQEEISVITWQDARYPRRLRHIADPPVVLYVKGHLPLMDEEAAIGVVGTRSATPYGLKMSRRMGAGIAACGGLVVTGLAAGIDSAAAEGALSAGGTVVGVLGTAIDVVYPRSNGPLFQDVMATGALVSEFPPGYPTTAGNFPIRNRIISGLSVGVLVVEAPQKSGALITAGLALEQGRDLFAVPSNADSPGGVGTNLLIRDCARCVLNGWHVMSEYADRFPEKVRQPDPAQQETVQAAAERERPGQAPAPEVPQAVPVIPLTGLTPTQQKIVLAMREPGMHIDDIIERTQLAASVVLSELTMLQLRGVVLQQEGKRFSLRPQPND